MRVWDVDPLELAQRHLCGEWLEVHQLFRAVAAVKAGDESVGWAHHPETQRFARRLDGLGLLVARADHLQYEGHRRGFRFDAPLVAEVDGKTLTDKTERLWVQYEFDGWYEFVVHSSWPTLDGTPASPWERDGVTYEHYRLHGRFADGRLEHVPLMPSPDTPGWGSDRTADPSE